MAVFLLLCADIFLGAEVHVHRDECSVHGVWAVVWHRRIVQSDTGQYDTYTVRVHRLSVYSRLKVHQSSRKHWRSMTSGNFYCPRKRRQYCYQHSFFFLSTFNATTHEPLHLAWWNFARTWTSTTSRSLLNFKVKVKGQSRIVFWCFLCLHDAAATRGCMTRTKTTSRSLLNIKVIGQGHMFLWVFCLHDSRGQYLDLSEGFTCVNVYSSKWWQNTRFVHWRRQLWGTGARAPPRPPASYVLREQIRKMYKNNAIFAQLLSIIGPFLSFFCPQFSSGSNYSSQNAGTIANKFQLHAYFRFR